LPSFFPGIANAGITSTKSRPHWLKLLKISLNNRLNKKENGLRLFGSELMNLLVWNNFKVESYGNIQIALSLKYCCFYSL